MKYFFLSLVICASSLCAQKMDQGIIRNHVTYLASDELKGRGTSSPEELLAANYIAGQFKMLGLGNFKNSYLKPFNYKYNPNPHDTVVKDVQEKTGNNVVGYLNNKAKYTIVIGAHYDHLGLGHDHNSLDA